MRVTRILVIASLVSLQSIPVFARELLVYGNGVSTPSAHAQQNLTLLENTYANHLGVSRDILEQAFEPVVAKNTTACETSENPSGSAFCLEDWYEALTQAAQDSGLTFSSSDIWNFLTGVYSQEDAFFDVLSAAALSLAQAFPQEQITNEDLRSQVEMYHCAIASGKRVLLVAHSQGNFFGNEAYNLLSTEERLSFGMVSVATPASFVAGGGPYRTSFTDFIYLVPGALPPNTVNGPLCIPGWGCHGFEHYVEGVVSGPQIMADIDDVLVSLQTPAINTKSLSLQRSSGQYLSLSDNAQTGLDLTADFTIEAWVKLATQIPAGQEYVLVSKWGSLSSNKSYLFLYYHDGLRTTLGLGTAATASSDDREVYVPYTLPLGEWTHLAVIFTAATGTAEFFVDGVSIGHASGLGTTVNNGAGAFQIGTRNGLAATAFDGLMDEVRVWSVARTPQEITDNYGKVLPASEPNLAGYWRFEGNGNDATNNGNQITALNGASFVVDVPFGNSGDVCHQP